MSESDVCCEKGRADEKDRQGGGDECLTGHQEDREVHSCPETKCERGAVRREGRCCRPGKMVPTWRLGVL